MKHFGILVLAALISTNAFAGEAEKAIADKWYAALSSINRTDVAALLADNAKITLGDLDVEQTKTEFLTSLDEWEDAMKGSTIRHAVETDADGVLTMLVCYKFPENETLGRESFKFEAGQIIESNQETVAETCDEFPG